MRLGGRPPTSRSLGSAAAVRLRPRLIASSCTPTTSPGMRRLRACVAWWGATATRSRGQAGHRLHIVRRTSGALESPQHGHAGCPRARDGGPYRRSATPGRVLINVGVAVVVVVLVAEVLAVLIGLVVGRLPATAREFS